MYILFAILVFGILIAVHELGHFLVAKACGVRVDEFAIGMGPARLAAMGQVAANRARRLYSVDAMCEATLAAYAQVLDARRAGPARR